jgi:hypothetical protein
VIDWLAMWKVGYFWALDGHYRRHLALVNKIHILSALKRYFLQHQEWPGQLQELDLESQESVLNDPLCNQPFVYERTNRGFRLYSRGPNGIDDGGVYNIKAGKDDIVLWPRPDFFEPAEATGRILYPSE